MGCFRRILIGVVVLVLLLLLVVPAGGWLYLRRSLPATAGSSRLAGLDGRVDVIRDANGIPYIYATTDHDAYYALGYVHAQDRLWQLEMSRRIGAGRLSEVLGEAALDTDMFLRTLGVYEAASAAWPSIAPSSQAALEAYAAGINSFLAEGHQLPPEFVVLGFKPEKWQPTDSLVWAKMMSWDLGETYGDDLLRAQLAASIGPERLAEIIPGYPADAPTILAADDPSLAGLLAVDDLLQTGLGLGGSHKGSNNWVVAGERTASGKPMLANDPHLGAQIPSIWYLAVVHGDRLHAAGATFPGLPTVVIGHNERVAWGVTNLGPDVQDLFVERVNPANPNQYEVNGQWVDMAVRAEDIRVKGAKEPVKWAARSTRHGPLISDVTDERGRALSLRWTSLDPGDTTIDAFLALNYAANWDDFRNSLRSFVAPSQNFVYADVDGNIGYFGPGRIPVRAHGDGSSPVPGWNDEYAWTGWIPFEELPQTFNPAAGYVVTANHKVTPPGYRHFISNDWAPPYRAERITELLTSVDKLTPDDFARIQADQTSAQARELLPVLLQVQPENPEQERALALLRDWDGNIAPGSAAAAIYEGWYSELFPALFGDDLGGTQGQGTLGRQDAVVLAEVLKNGSSPWCDDVLKPDAQTCLETARAALDRALEKLSEKLGADMSRWQWSKLHVMRFPHNPFTNVSPLNLLFDRSAPVGGDRYTVNPTSYDIRKPFDSKSLSSYRQILDLADWDNSRFMHTTGQSGNVLSPHYADFLDEWQHVTYVPLFWTREKLEATGGTSTLVLEPSPAD